MISTASADDILEFRGLSSDIKPIGRNAVNGNVDLIIGNGSCFFEMDTSEVYMLSLTVDSSKTITGTWLKI